MSNSNPVSIQSYAQLQAYMDQMIQRYSTGISGAPHKAFWNTLTYEQFTTGNVPRVNPPVRILVLGAGAGSNIVQALQGVGPLFGPSGTFGIMPADGTGPWTADEIKPLIDWINANCPNNASP
jgi:hypothetical protein